MFQLKWVWKQMEGFRKRYIFALCSTALLAVLALGNSTITAMIMDTVFSPLQESGVVTEQVFQHLIFLVALLIGFTLFRTSFQYLSIMTYAVSYTHLVGHKVAPHPLNVFALDGLVLQVLPGVPDDVLGHALFQVALPGGLSRLDEEQLPYLSLIHISLVNAIMFTPCWPSAGPTGGAGVALPAGI